MKIKSSVPIGKQAEAIATTFLVGQGLLLIEQNFYCRFGEIDIIMLDQQLLIFVEVRYRKNERIMSVLETVDQAKCNKIIMTSQYYLNKRKDYQGSQYRYDLIAISGQFDKPKIRWIKDAFQA